MFRETICLPFLLQERLGSRDLAVCKQVQYQDGFCLGHVSKVAETTFPN